MGCRSTIRRLTQCYSHLHCKAVLRSGGKCKGSVTKACVFDELRLRVVITQFRGRLFAGHLHNEIRHSVLESGLHALRITPVHCESFARDVPVNPACNGLSMSLGVFSMFELASQHNQSD